MDDDWVKVTKITIDCPEDNEESVGTPLSKC